jgi:hypothetical protein
MPQRQTFPAIIAQKISAPAAKVGATAQYTTELSSSRARQT